MDSSVSLEDQIWFLRVCHHVPFSLYNELVVDSARVVCWDSCESPYCGSGTLYLYIEQYRLMVFQRTWTAVILRIQYIHKRMVPFSKVNKKFISHLTRAQRTPSAAATVQVSHALPAVRFSCLLRGRGASFQNGVAAGNGFLCAPF